MSKSQEQSSVFWQSNSYRQARQRAEADLDNWRKAEQARSIRGLTWLCVGLSIGIVAIWMGIAYYVSNGH
jgi:hypothetical protein